MNTISRILQSKPDSTVYSIAPDAMVLDALRLMAEKDIGALLVMEGERILGILTERDYARKMVLMGRASSETPARAIMTSLVIYVSPDRTNEECMALMTENRMRHLPVIDNGKLVGIVSTGDLMKDIISGQRFTTEQLGHYIQGERG